MNVPIDLETLRLIWWILLGVLLAGFAIMDGFDLGAMILLPIIARKDIERRVVINTIGPVWEGNQVWFITAGGALFAAWPLLYAISFSGFYFAMFLVLAALIVRPVSIKYRSKMPSTRWRKNWDRCLVVSGLVPALIFGVAIGNVLQGVPFYFDENIRAFYTGSFWDLLNPLALSFGLGSIAMLCMHGGMYVATKTESPLRRRAIAASRSAGFVFLISFLSGLYFLTQKIQGYQLSSVLPLNSPSNPLHKTVLHGATWMHNFNNFPKLWSLPIIVVISILCVLLLAGRGRSKMAFLFSCSSIGATIATIGVTLFPFLLPSSTNPNMSLTVWDASSSQLTLFIMTIAAGIFVPIILLYTAWVYRVMRGTITESKISGHQSTEMY